jgi:hypothetical protein
MGPLTHISNVPAASSTTSGFSTTQSGTSTLGHPQISVQPDSEFRFIVNGEGFPFFDTTHVRIAWDDTLLARR